MRDGIDGANGVYQYGASAFPTQTFQSEGYFVDVVFNTTNGPDVTAPLVTSATPVVGVSGIPINTNVRASFNEAMNATTINTNTFLLRDAANNLVPAAVTYDTSTRTATLDPTSSLQYLTLYTATVKGGTTDPRVKDTAGNALASDHVWSFTTAAPPPPPPTQGPGGPVLVVTSSANPFTTYLAEILRTEGLNAFTTADLTTVNAGTLTSYDVVILGEMPLTTGQVTMFSDWVTQGGNLIAMRPDKKLAPMLGLTDVGTTLAEAYLLVNTATAPGAGIVNQTIQFHGTADRYTLNGATVGGDVVFEHDDRDRASRRHHAHGGQRQCRRLHLRPRAFGGLHPPGQPGVVRPGTRRTAANSQRRSLLRRQGGRHPARLGQPEQGRPSRRPTSSSACCGTSS